MTMVEYKTTVKAIQQASSIFNKDDKKARKFLYDIGLIDKAGKPKKMNKN